MKRFFSALLGSLLFISIFSACNSDNENIISTEKKISVIATIFAPYDFTREIAGDNAEITMLLPPASEPHSYEPTPRDIISIRNCDIFIYVGGESDSWVEGILSSADTSKMKIITLMDCVETVEEEYVEGMQIEESEENEPEYDEHVWTSPRNAKLIVEKISEALRECDADNAEIYESNTAAYLERLNQLDSDIKKMVSEAARNTLVFGDRFPFRYLADAYGFEYFAAFPGCSSETEAGAKTVAFLINKIRDENIPVVFYIELSNEKMAKTIAAETGAEALMLHACHNITKSDFENGVSYIDLMNKNIAALKKALG